MVLHLSQLSTTIKNVTQQKLCNVPYIAGKYIFQYLLFGRQQNIISTYKPRKIQRTIQLGET